MRMRPCLLRCIIVTFNVVCRYMGYDGSVDPSDTETGFVCQKKHAKLNELQEAISKDLDWRAYVEVAFAAASVAAVGMLTLSSSFRC